MGQSSELCGFYRFLSHCFRIREDNPFSAHITLVVDVNEDKRQRKISFNILFFLLFQRSTTRLISVQGCSPCSKDLEQTHSINCVNAIRRLVRGRLPTK